MPKITIDVTISDHPTQCETEEGEWCFFLLNNRCDRWNKELKYPKGYTLKCDDCLNSVNEKEKIIPVKLLPIIIRFKDRNKSPLMTVVENPDEYWVVRTPGETGLKVFKKDDCEVVEIPYKKEKSTKFKIHWEEIMGHELEWGICIDCLKNVRIHPVHTCS